jgi:hypothetical protein
MEKIMRAVKAKLHIPIKVVRNTDPQSKSPQKYAKIIDQRNGVVRHIGQLNYIRRVAQQRYNVQVNL